jgi:hypothetical protein
MQMHLLKPFYPALNPTQIFATAERIEDRLTFEFHTKLSAEIGNWKTWPRADELWKSTCYETFFGVQGQKGYWELNLSPSKQRWNLYSFDSYRSPQPPRPSMDLELIEVTVGEISLSCVLQAKQILPQLDVSLCAVVRYESGVGYYALHHPAENPDFHQRESFNLKC